MVGHSSFVIREKLRRIRNGGPIRTLDLFAGCGGLSLGFHAAGYQIVAAVENDPVAAQSHAYNFFRNSPKQPRELHARPRDIVLTSPEELVSELELGPSVDDAVDVIIGGPPCQAFARVGRAKLREVFERPDAFLQDPRANLYLRYLAYVQELKPVAILMENVPDVLNYGGHNIPEEICEVLEQLGYVCGYTLLNAAYYGVPQMRERMFLIAYARESEAEISFPNPTHWIDLPRGYEGSRRVALRTILRLFQETSHCVPPPEPSPDLPPAITAQEAIGDLPPITEHLEGKLKRGVRRFTNLIPYPGDAVVSRYAWLMRNWPGFENHDGVRDHVIRYLPRDYRIFRRMKPGDQYPEAYQHAMALFQEELERLAAQGISIEPGTRAYEELKRSIVPPYDPSKFPNKWRKMEPDAPARTLMAHLGKDSYSHIHYDSSQARTISVREAARLQSFPDGFVFCGSMNAAFRQIGNAVPPLLANILAVTMMEALRIPRCVRPLVRALIEDAVVAP